MLSSSSQGLPGETLVEYLWSSVKIFGYWASVAAERWDSDQQAVVLEIISAMKRCLEAGALHSDFGVQEIVNLTSLN